MTMTTTEEKQKTAVIYARYSSIMQKDSSIDGQVRFCKKLAEREGLKIIQTFEDRAKSGQSEAGRDGYAAMMAGARKRAFDVLIIENLDRAGRGSFITRMKEVLDFNRVDVLTARGWASRTDVAVQGLVNSLDKGTRATNVRRGHDNCVALGKIPGSVAYGYRPIPGKPGEHEIDPEQEKIVVRIFREYASGRSPRKIAADLTKEGVPTPRSHREKRYAGSTTWNSQAFVGGMYAKGILGNRKYIGEIDWNTHSTEENPDTQKKVKLSNPKDQHLRVLNPKLRIIPQNLWDAAQKVRTDRSVKKFGADGKVTRRPVVARGEHLLSGLLRCGTCNGHMRISNTSRNGTSRVACAAAHQHHTCEHTKTYDVDELKNGILAGMTENLLSDEMIDAALGAYRTEKNQGVKNDSEKKAVERKLNALNLEIARLVDATMKTDNPPAEFYKKIDAKEVERASLDERLHQLGGPGGSNNLLQFPIGSPKFKDIYRKSVFEVHRAMTKKPDTPESREAFRNLIDSIVVHPTAKRMPYEFTPYARIAAIQGVNLFPACRTTKEVIAAQGLSCSDNANTEKSVSS
jgi:DNA invertase Pin-like site-specific DNA recombinase